MVQLTKVDMPRDGQNQSRHWFYDDYFRVTRIYHPEKGNTDYTYVASGNGAGQILTIANGGKSQTFTYDSYGRVIKKENSIDACQAIYFTYDTAVDSSWQDNLNGRLSEVRYKGPADASAGTSCDPSNSNYDNGLFRERFTYTAPGQMAQKRLLLSRKVINSGQLSTKQISMNMSWTYNQAGQAASITYPAAPNINGGQAVTVNYSYDAYGRQTTISGGAGNGSASFNERGQVTSAGGQSFAYNEWGQLGWMTGNGQSITYSYDTTGNNDGKILSQSMTSGETVQYQYDMLGRLSKAETQGPQWGINYTFDGYGNKLAQSVSKGTAASHSFTMQTAANPHAANQTQVTNRIVGQNYSSSGELTSLNGVSLGYDGFGRNTQVGQQTWWHSGAGADRVLVQK
jgi:YD repeat-containing protein